MRIRENATILKLIQFLAMDILHRDTDLGELILQLIFVLLKNILRRDADLGEVFRQFGEQRDQLGNG